MTIRSALPIFLFAVFCLYSNALFSQESKTLEKRSYQTFKKGEGQNINIDAHLDEAAWDLIDWGTDFTVHRPNNGDQPKKQTKFKILYDDSYIYVGFKCLDDEPDKVVKRLARRDYFPGDWVEINIDSYHDNSTAFSFSISASGVKGDEFISSDGNNWDDSWNPIWYAAAEIVEDGWQAEIKIPLSQLRFGKQDQYTWGFNITRNDFRSDERSVYQFVPQNLSGWVSNFANLEGIQGIEPKRQVEIQPYVVGGLKRSGASDGNPSETDFRGNIGLDGKIGITSDLTLDFTINPDFGQVEADPSNLNIDGYQIFFGERRPFFIENSNLFDFTISNTDAGGPHGNDNLFYSRRIGRSPRGSINQDGEEYDRPDFTNIIGAAKFSGKTKEGWSLGIMESVTSKEFSKVLHNGESNDVQIEPLTNYFVSRLSKDINGGDTQIGGTLTHLNRFLDNTSLEDQYHKNALTGGINIFHSWKDRQWQLKANYIGSTVKGTEEKILETQTSFAHYFQRPDADHLSIDSTATSMTGTGGRLSIANYGGEDNISFETGVTFRSPTLELNDLGFLNFADGIFGFTWAGWRSPKAFGIFRSARVNLNHYHSYTYSGKNVYHAVNTNIHGSFKNFMEAGTGINYEFKDLSTKALFGGPILRNHKGFFNWVYWGSDTRKKIRFNINAGKFTPVGNDKGAINNYNVGFTVFYQPSNAFSIRLSPFYEYRDRVMQNVSLAEMDGADRYITAKLERKTFALSLRASYSFTPNLTLEYWGQPYISIGQFDEYKYISDPLALDYRDRFELYTDNQVKKSDDDIFNIDENLDGNIDYSFDDPDFNFIEFRSNMVLRWEYIPGSELFFVWSQNTIGSGDPTKGIFPSLSDDLFGNSIDNILLVKATFRFIR